MGKPFTVLTTRQNYFLNFVLNYSEIARKVVQDKVQDVAWELLQDGPFFSTIIVHPVERLQNGEVIS